MSNNGDREIVSATIGWSIMHERVQCSEMPCKVSNCSRGLCAFDNNISEYLYIMTKKHRAPLMINKFKSDRPFLRNHTLTFPIRNTITSSSKSCTSGGSSGISTASGSCIAEWMWHSSPT